MSPFEIATQSRQTFDMVYSRRTIRSGWRSATMWNTLAVASCPRT